MTTLDQAIELAAKDKAEGHIIAFTVSDGVLDVLTDQGWRQYWPNDPEPDNHPD